MTTAREFLNKVKWAGEAVTFGDIELVYTDRLSETGTKVIGGASIGRLERRYFERLDYEFTKTIKDSSDGEGKLVVKRIRLPYYKILRILLRETPDRTATVIWERMK